MVNVQSLVHGGAWCWGKTTDSLLCYHLRTEVLVVVLVTSPAFSLAKFGISLLCLKGLTLLVHTEDGGKITKAKDLDSVKLELRQCRDSPTWTSPVQETLARFLCCHLVFGCNICLYGWPAQWLIADFVAAPTSLSLWRTPAGSAWGTHSYSAADPAARGGGPAGRSSQ